MAEDKTPSAAATGGVSGKATASSDQPGRPYYENLRATLRQAIQKKEILDAELAALEDKIYRDESSYLEDTVGAGNIVRGFDNWVKGVVVSGGRGDDRKARSNANRVREDDRIFSRSSVTWLKSQEQPGPPSIATSSPGTGTQTPAVAASAPKSATTQKNRKKSLAALEKDDDDDTVAKPAKRTKISCAGS